MATVSLARLCRARPRHPRSRYREVRVDLRPVFDAVRRDAAEVSRPLRIGFLAAVFLAATMRLFDDRFLVAADSDFVFCLFTVAKFFFFDAPFLSGADVDFVFCLVPAARFFAAPITAPETAPITVPTTGAPRAVPATAPATAPPRVLPTEPFVA